MPIRHLSNAARRLIQLALGVVLVGVVAFFALTRTEVGRDALRAEIERRFDERFAGRLEIGTLSGNLVYDLYAQDVRVYGPDGALVLQADSVVARPSWKTLFGRQITARALTLFRPEAYLVRRPGGRWNIQEAFNRPRRRASASSAEEPFSFAAATTRIVDGHLFTHNAGTAPEAVQAGRVFDYANTRLEAVRLEATVEWQPDGTKLVDLFSFEAALPEQDVRIRQLQGQMALAESTLALSQVVLRTGTTALDFSAALTGWAAGRSLWQADPEVDLDLAESRIDHEEVRRFFPAWPLSDATMLRARIEGPLSHLVVDEVRIGRGASALAARGTLSGLPEAARFDAMLENSVLTARDVEAVFPAAPAEALGRLRRLGPVALDADAEGAVPLRAAQEPLRLAADLVVRSDAGAVTGTAAFARMVSGVTYRADLQLDTLRLARLAPEAGVPGRLTGQVQINGRGTTAATASGTLALRLTESELAGRPIPALRLDARADSGSAEGTLEYGQRAGGTLRATGAVRYAGAPPAFDLRARSRRLDLGPLFLSDSLATRLTADIRAEGGGASWPEASGRIAVAFDSSLVRRGEVEGRILPHRSALVLAEAGAAAPRLRLTGALATLTLDGDVAVPPLRALGRLWADAFAQAARTALSKRAAQPAMAQAAEPEPPADPALREAARAALRDAGLDGLDLRADFLLKRPDLLTALFPRLPLLEADLHATLALTASADRLRSSGTASTDTLRVGRLRADTLRANFVANAALDAPLVQTLDVRLNADAAALSVGERVRFRAPRLNVSYAERGGEVRLSTASTRGQSGPLRFLAGLEVLPDRTRLVVRDVHLEAGSYVWETPEAQPVDLFADAVRIPGLQLVGRSGGKAEPPQRLRIAGTLSSAPGDTLRAEVDGLLLRPASDFFNLKRPLGGRLNGRLLLTGGLRQPELTGGLAVSRLAFDDRLLGNLSVESRYVPGASEVALDARLRPSPPDTSARIAEIPLRSEESRLRLRGTFRLPTLGDLAAGRPPADPGALDLSLDARRADLFFFEYIFQDQIENVEGYLTGEGTVQGTFRLPLFQADLRAVDGQFSVPQFGLTYALEGPVAVDAEGIGVDGVLVTGPDGGTAALSGQLLFNGYDYFSFDLSARLDKLQIIDVEDSRELPFYGSIWASGPVTLTGPLSSAALRSSNIRTTDESELFIPITESDARTDTGYILFADSTGQVPDLEKVTRRRNLLSDRPVGERSFLDGLEMDLNVYAPGGSTVHLVFDPLLGDVLSAVGSGRIQLQRQGGDFFTYGTFDVDAGEYLFTAGELFYRRFDIEGGTISWDGPPANAKLGLTASYHTRASTAGLGGSGGATGRIPLVVLLEITGRVEQPAVDLSLRVDRSERFAVEDFSATALETILNQPDRETEYATSVLLTNTFLLTTDLARNPAEGSLADTGGRLAFNSVSQLVASQVNRYLSAALPGLDFRLGVQGENPEDRDVIYGLALRLLDERLIIRGEGVFVDTADEPEAQGLEGEFVVEVRLSPSVSVEAFYRREGSVLSEQTLTSTTGAGVSYQTEFRSWKRLFERFFGWLWPGGSEDEEAPPAGEAVAAGVEE